MSKFRIQRAIELLRPHQAAIITSQLTPGAIGTHDGTFHCDEALACGLIMFLPQFRDVEIVRTRNSAILDQCSIVVDVGGVFIPEKLRFDHHFVAFTETMPNFCTKLSSAGLIYRHFGHEILSTILDNSSINIDDIYGKIYATFVESIDGIDNGIDWMNDSTNTQMNYDISSSLLSNRVGQLNPYWNDDVDSNNANESFSRAIQLTSSEFINQVHHIAYSWLPARREMSLSLSSSLSCADRVCVLFKYFPWQDHLLEMEVNDYIKFVVYPDVSNTWRVQTVPITTTTANGKKSSIRFSSRVLLPETWRGKRFVELDNASELNGCIFCHSNGFIGGNQTIDGAIDMAVKAIQIHEMMSSSDV